jgi:hypothetical protein
VYKENLYYMICMQQMQWVLYIVGTTKAFQRKYVLGK